MYIPVEYLICCLLMVGIFLAVMAIALVQATNDRRRQKEAQRLSKAFDHLLHKYVELEADCKKFRARIDLDAHIMAALETVRKEGYIMIETVRSLVSAVGTIMSSRDDGIEIEQLEIQQRLDQLMGAIENKALDEFWRQL